MKLSCFSSPTVLVSSSNKKLTAITQSPKHPAEIKSSKSKQLQQTDFNCFEEQNLKNIISELEKTFNYNDSYDKHFPIYLQLWNEINKSDDHRNYVLWEAQAGKGKRSEALCCFLVEYRWLLTHSSMESSSKSQVLDDFRREALCEQALRKLVTRGIQNVIVSIVDKKNHSPAWEANKEQEKQENIISQISYILGLTKDKNNGAKNRLGMDPISNVIFTFASQDLIFIQKLVGGENPALKITHTIADSYYKSHSKKEKLPSKKIIDRVQNEIIETIYRNSEISIHNASSSINQESNTYRIISKAILDPAISKKHQQQMTSKIRTSTYRENNGEKKRSTAEIQKEYLVVDETLDLKSSQLYKDVNNYLLSINKNLTENDISLCAEDYYEFYRERLDLNVPPLVLLKSFQSQRDIQNKIGIQNKRYGIILTNN
ncbi:hypothetical protein [Yersinia proxima]|uniref:hypothetical protein n=1 Tax=Yersinia proxima TaxID=2890316 RepID=UPI0037D653DA